MAGIAGRATHGIAGGIGIGRRAVGGDIAIPTGADAGKTVGVAGIAWTVGVIVILADAGSGQAASNASSRHHPGVSASVRVVVTGSPE
ncbi:MAG: hypothetical protein R3D57_03195 [Hyphomicrobiaceae bacterium]